MPHFANNSTKTPSQSRFSAQPTRRKSGLNDQLSQRKSYSSLQQIQKQQQQQDLQQQFSYSQSSSSSSSSNTYNLGPPPATPIANSMGRSRPASSLASFNAKTPSSVVRRPTTPRTTVRSKTSMSNITTPVRSRPSSSLSSHSASSIPNVSYSGTIKVAVRPKPLNDSQLNNHPWTVNQYGNTISSFELGEFSYDKVFDPMVDNSEVFETCVEPVVNQCLDGFNGTIFAYGMTGSGKTYSMQGSENEIGIIPLAAEQIFTRVKRESLLSKHYKISCSYLEIYNERIFDLLNPDSSNKLKQSSYSNSSINNSNSNNTDELKIRNDTVYGVKVMGLREIQVETSEELIKVIEGGDSIRRTGGTDFNARSSRSHAVLMIRILCVDGNKERFSSLCLCDLAGSEKATTQQERRKEGSFINKSLLALSTVVSKLSQQSSQPISSSSLNSSSSSSTSGSSSNMHIPYRDSKLTRLLQPSLSGNSVVSILCTIHLSQSTYSETLNTLRFAARAKNISLSAKKNEISSLQSMPNSEKDKLVHQLMRENELQKIEIEALKIANDGVKTSLFAPTATSSSSSTSANATPLVKNDNDNNGRKISSNSGIGGGVGQYDKFSEEFSQLTAENKILNEQVEHLRRMSDYSKLDSIMINNEKLNLLSTQFEVRENGEEFRQIINSLENYYRTQVLQVEEMKSYISHLEQSLRIAEYDRQVSINSSINNELNNGNSILENLVKDQEEEILSLKRSLGSKDSIINALKSASRLRDTVSSHSSNNNYGNRISSRNGDNINNEDRNTTGSVNDNNNNASINSGNDCDEQRFIDSNDENLDISRATKKTFLQPIENKLSSNNN
ncbi:hypothetical protein B5S29_g873 [[Candida] boidinii]|nr:hypothetical protein B5S29_g873 [[Candida] boidinii]